jgi:Na+/H+-dicarboxylate symporter
MQLTAQQALDCTHCALRWTLVAACAIHNGNIVAKAEMSEACCVAPGICANSRLPELTGVKMSSRFTQFILIAMALGIVMGSLIFNYLPDSRVEIAADVNLIAMLFLRLIKMIIAPLVFATLVGGIAHMGSGAKLGRIFAKTMGWFVSASFISLLLGLVMVNLLQPGANFPGTLPDKAQSTGLPVSAFSIEKFLTHLIPTSIADAMAQNEILQIVVFAVM